MKRLSLIVVYLFVLGIMGIFATQNNHSVSIKIYENFSIQVSVWILIVLSFVAGWALTEFWLFFTNPNRFVKSIFGKFSQYKEQKSQRLTQNFEEASLLRDSKKLKKNYKKLDSRNIPIHIRLKYIGQLRYENSKEELLLKFAELRTEYQGDLEVLLPYLKLASEVREWDLTESLAQEILHINAAHPDAMEGLRKCYIARQDWIKCIEQERNLLGKYKESFFMEDLIFEHEGHLLKALMQDPSSLKNWSFGYLSHKKVGINKKKLEVIRKSFHLKKSGLLLGAAKVLKKALKKNAYHEYIEELENIYYESARDEQILEIVGDLHNSKNNSIIVSILFAKLLYKNNKLDQAKKVLNELQLNENISNLEDQERNEKWQNIFHVLRFFIYIRQENSKNVIKEAQLELMEEKFL